MLGLLGPPYAWAAEGERPKRHPEFVEGYIAYKRDEDWTQAARKMYEAQQNWPEDGKNTRGYGRWPVAYLPLAFLGASLYRMDCKKTALEQFEKSQLSQDSIKGFEKEREFFEELREMDWNQYEESPRCVEWQEPLESDTSGERQP